jgi:glutathione S-transferase
VKLLSSPPSPFAGRVRLAIYAKALPVEIQPADMWLPEGGKSPAYLAINPLGKVPALVLDDGTVIPESDTIVEYLADLFPESGLRPRAPLDIAQVRLLARIIDLYVLPHAAGLVAQLDPSTRNPAKVARGFDQMAEGLSWLELRLPGDPYAVGDTLTLADCAMVPHLFFFGETLGRILGREGVIGAHPKLAAWWGRVRRDPAVERLLGEMAEGFAASRLGRWAPAD